MGGLEDRSEPTRATPQIQRRRVESGLRARFEAVAMPHLDSVYRIARVLSSNPAEADDLVQETYVRALKAFERFELREFGARPWLLRILHNVFYTMRSRQRRSPTLLEDVDFEHASDEMDGAWVTIDSINWDRVDEEIKHAVDQLQPEYRTALLLWGIEGLSYKEIAEVCDCALGTVMSRLYRARQLVGNKLLEYARQRGIPSERFET